MRTPPISPRRPRRPRLWCRLWSRPLLAALLTFAPVAIAAAQPAVGDDPRARQLAERATARRAQQLADTALRDYQAVARGYLTFLAQVGEGFPEPPRVVKADELALEVYWKAPDHSKQVLVGQRDTLLLPADVGYYRDRYGIVQNNFADRIRLGDGNDVRDVPHPLSAIGLREYHFTLGDSITIRTPGRAIAVYELRVRPVDERQPRAVGTLYVDRETAAVARMALTFTRAAILDKRIETLTVTLENGLVDGRFWLPYRQELEVARTSSWLDFPARGIIRGRWQVADYRVNVGLADAFFTGPEIVSAPPSSLRRYAFPGSVLDSLPGDVVVAREEDVQRVRAQAEALVRERALARATSGPALSAGRVSDFVRVNRVEGLALGLGTRWRPAPRVSLAVSARYGLSDEQLKGRVALGRTRSDGRQVELFAERAHRDAGDVPERSLVVNTLAAQEFGSDYTDPYDVRAAGLGATLGERWGVRWRAEGAYERHRAVQVNATPANGQYAPTIPAAALRGPRLSLFAERPTAAGPWGTSLRVKGELRGGWMDGDDAAGTTPDARFVRGDVVGEAERAFAPGRLVLRTTVAGVVGADAPAQQLVYQGGPMSGPGYRYHELAGRLGASQRVEWRTPLPFPSLPLGRYGRTPGAMTLAPYAHASYVGRPPLEEPRAEGVYPALGVGGLFFFDLLRVDVARGLRDGRWTFNVDIATTLWGIL